MAGAHRKEYAAVLGRNPSLSAAELQAMSADVPENGEARLALSPLNPDAVKLTGDAPRIADRLGGTIKLVELAGVAGSPEEAVAKLAGAAKIVGKVTFGISVYGNASPKLAVAAKKYLKQRGLRARFVPATGPLNLAQVKHNGLLDDGFEWCLFETGDGWHYGRTIWIPDFEGFAKRDFKKPVADAKRGMLPPQLARVMVNLATRGADNATVYDPFCGVGGLLLEAVNAGYRAIGSDLDPAAVEGARQNLEWLGADGWQVSVHDATTSLPVQEPVTIATEGCLGAPIRESTSEAEIAAQQGEVSELLIEFFKQAAAGQRLGDRLVMTLPIWKAGSRKIQLEIIDQLCALGYTKVRPLPRELPFPVSDRDSIEVARPKQRVIHELFIFERT